MEKIFNHKSLKYFVWTSLGSKVNIWINCFLQAHFKVHSKLSNIVPIILPPVSLTPGANLLPVSLIPVVHLDLRISPRIFGNILKDPKVILIEEES